MSERELGGPAEPVRYIGGEAADPRAYDGRLRYAVGAQSFQVVRSSRGRPAAGEEPGWTYLNAQFLAHWRGQFLISYIEGPVGEHLPPSRTMLVTSPDGVRWGEPQVLFPPYQLPDGGHALMHQRMGFYLAPDGRLLALGFYGLAPSPNNGRGIGRVVRELYAPDRLGPIFFLRYNRHAGWDETNTAFPSYSEAPDPGFRAACDALLADRLLTQQWWEEDRSPDGFYAIAGEIVAGFDGKAFNHYRRADGTVVGLWKWAFAALSTDDGASWATPARVPSLVMAGAKVWGERTADGRYALVYNPVADNNRRWPLAVVSGDDGIRFDELCAIQGEVPPRRYGGQYKDYGPQYVRGIEADDGGAPRDALWLTYAMNKEDLWVSRLPLPIRAAVAEPVADRFADFSPGPLIPGWNSYSPRLATVRVAEAVGGPRCLELRDADPHDYAQAVRVFPESRTVTLTLGLAGGQHNHGQLAVELQDRHGRRPVQLALDGAGNITAADGGRTQVLQPYRAGVWYELELRVDLGRGRYSVTIDGTAVLAEAAVAEQAGSVERLHLRSGPFRAEPTVDSPPATPQRPGDDLPDPDRPVPPAVFWVRAVTTRDHNF
jgi:hypothetical protein